MKMSCKVSIPRIARVRMKAGGATLHPIQGGVRPDGSFSAPLLSMAHDLVTAVKSGLITGVALVWFGPENAAGEAWSGDLPVYRTLGGISVLSRAFLDATVERRPEIEGGPFRPDAG